MPWRPLFRVKLVGLDVLLVFVAGLFADSFHEVAAFGSLVDRHALVGVRGEDWLFLGGCHLFGGVFLCGWFLVVGSSDADGQDGDDDEGNDSFHSCELFEVFKFFDV